MKPRVQTVSEEVPVHDSRDAMLFWNSHSRQLHPFCYTSTTATCILVCRQISVSINLGNQMIQTSHYKTTER